MKLRHTLVALLYVIHAGFFVARVDAQEVVLKVHHLLPPVATGHAKLIAPWCERLAKDSGGRLKCQIYPAMQLGGTSAQLFDQVKDGVADVTWGVTGYTPGRFPKVEVFELPFIITNAIASSQAIFEFVQRYDQDEFRDVHPLAFHQHGPAVFHMRDIPVNTLADLKGRKVRAPTRFTNKLLADLGATPVGILAPQVPEALSKGVVDGVLFPWEVVPAFKIDELTRYHSETDPKYNQLYSSVFFFAMNRRKYDALPVELRKVLDANSGMELTTRFARAFLDGDVAGRDAAIKAGGRFNTIPATELEKWRTLAQPVVDGWVKDVTDKGHDGKKLLEAARALIAKYTK